MTAGTLHHRYAKAGVLTNPMPSAARGGGQGGKSENTRAVLHFAAKYNVKQGATNNVTANGMKHFKNQSLCF